MAFLEGAGGSIVSGLASLAGGFLQNKANKKAAARQMAFQLEANQKQMDFQERMSNTSYQRSMEDMRAAGLNPILAYQRGGASTPGGGTSAGAGYTAQNILGPAVSSALDAQRVRLQTKTTKATISNIHEDTNQKFSQRWLNQSLRNRNEQQLRNDKVAGKILLEKLHVHKAEASSAKAAESFYNSPYGKALRWVDLTGRAVNPFSSIGGDASRWRSRPRKK